MLDSRKAALGLGHPCFRDTYYSERIISQARKQITWCGICSSEYLRKYMIFFQGRIHPYPWRCSVYTYLNNPSPRSDDGKQKTHPLANFTQSRCLSLLLHHQGQDSDCLLKNSPGGKTHCCANLNANRSKISSANPVLHITTQLHNKTGLVRKLNFLAMALQCFD